MKLNSKILALVIHASVVSLSLHAFAGREDFNKPSKELADAIATSATSMGYDLSSKDGRKQFGDYMKTQRDTLATSLGIDMSTDEGRKKYHEAVKTHHAEVAAAQSIDLTTKEGKDALEKYLISTGDYAYVRPSRDEKRGKDDGRDREKKEMKKDDDQVVRDDKDQKRPKFEGERQGDGQQAAGERPPPPPAREREQGQRPEQAKDASQQQGPEQRQ